MERVAENLNRALHAAFAADPDLFLLGEDVADPYGGAFKITKGLSSGYPDRVLSTPISEQSLVGVANGLALSGGRAVVEIMFGDFATLAFDQIVNFAAKSVAMYGRRVDVPVVVRCPTGGRRGYGPTHSQSLQKHFIGVPHLSVHEISPFHDNTALLAGLLADGERPSCSRTRCSTRSRCTSRGRTGRSSPISRSEPAARRGCGRRTATTRPTA